jgi:ATP synthase F1 gamma subunit
LKMPSLIDIRRRIRAVKSTQQITKAMKMVAASRMRARTIASSTRARSGSRCCGAARPDVARRSGAHPLLRCAIWQAWRRIQLIGSQATRAGGSFNSNVIKAAAPSSSNTGSQIELVLVGRKGRDFFRAAASTCAANTSASLPAGVVTRVCDRKEAIDDFTADKLDGLFIVYNEFKSIIRRRSSSISCCRSAADARPRLSSAARSRRCWNDLDRDRDGRIDPGSAVDYLYEPDPATIFAECSRGTCRRSVARAARIERGLLCGADDGDGSRDEELGRDAGVVDALS